MDGTMTTTASLKLKGKKLFRGEVPVATVSGYREHSYKFGPTGSFCVVADGKKIADGFCYFRDAVQWARAAAERGEI
jgi:ApbE superfamily uncharacterized protein (UPF0280 family)